MRGAPQSGFSRVICLISARRSIDLRTSYPVPGLPSPVAAKPGPMPPHERLGSDDMKHLEDGWKQSIELDEDPPIEVGQTNPAPALTPQHEQLVAQDRILGLKPRVRSTRRDQDGQNRPEE